MARAACSISSRTSSCEAALCLCCIREWRLMDSLLAARWGRNSHGVTSPSSADSAASPASSSQAVKRPSIASPLSDLVLRDLALSATYGVAVDANGDVLQWGAGFQPSGHVERTVQGRDIVKVAATQEGKVFGLSKKGDVFVWAAEKEMQKVDGGKRVIGGIELPRSQEGAGWMWVLGKGTVWGRGSNDRVETVRLGTDVKLDRGERYVDPASSFTRQHDRALSSL